MTDRSNEANINLESAKLAAANAAETLKAAEAAVASAKKLAEAAENGEENYKNVTTVTQIVEEITNIMSSYVSGSPNSSMSRSLLNFAILWKKLVVLDVKFSDLCPTEDAIKNLDTLVKFAKTFDDGPTSPLSMLAMFSMMGL